MHCLITHSLPQRQSMAAVIIGHRRHLGSALVQKSSASKLPEYMRNCIHASHKGRWGPGWHARAPLAKQPLLMECIFTFMYIIPCYAASACELGSHTHCCLRPALSYSTPSALGVNPRNASASHQSNLIMHHPTALHLGTQAQSYGHGCLFYTHCSLCAPFDTCLAQVLAHRTWLPL